MLLSLFFVVDFFVPDFFIKFARKVSKKFRIVQSFKRKKTIWYHTFLFSRFLISFLNDFYSSKSVFRKEANPSLFLRLSSIDTPSLLRRKSIASPSFWWSIDGLSMDNRWIIFGSWSEKDVRKISCLLFFLYFFCHKKFGMQKGNLWRK